MNTVLESIGTTSSIASSVLVIRLLAAAVLGALVAYRPWGLMFRSGGQRSGDTAQAQVVIAVAGCLMVMVIGESMARAFGLVGLGSFIRFRSGIKDPRDAASMFVMIGIGMAIGLGLLEIALPATAFVCLLLAGLEATARVPVRRIRVGIDLTEPFAALAALRAGAFPGARILEAPDGATADGRIVLEVDAVHGADAASILEVLRVRGIVGVKAVSVADE